MFRILLSVILFMAKLQAAAGDNLVQKDLGFRYSLKENGNGSVIYNIPEYSLESFTTEDGKVYKKPVIIDAATCELPTEPSGAFTVCLACPRYTQYISSELAVADVNVSVVPLAVYAVVGSCLTKFIKSANSFSLVTALSSVYEVVALVLKSCFAKLIKLSAGSLPI